MISAACKARMHQWGAQGARAGAVCAGCGKRYGERKSRVYPEELDALSATEVEAMEQVPAQSAPASDELSARRIRNAALAARWGVAPAQTESPNPEPVPPSPPAETSDAGGEGKVSAVEAEKLAAMLKPYVRDGLLASERWIIDWRGYIPKDVPEDQREELGECVEVVLRKLLPDVAVGPWAKLGFVLTMCYAAQRVGAEKKPKEQAVLSPAGARDSALKADVAKNSPSNSSPSESSATDAFGSVETAVPNA